jgi:nucleotide-binding universal stress UspA family protein
MGSLRSIVAGIDFSSSSCKVMSHAAKLASADGCPLVAAHVISSSRIRDWERSSGYMAATAARVLDTSTRLEDLATECAAGIKPEFEVRIGRPGKVLDDLVRDHLADLLVLGAHDVSRRRLGSVASRCVRSTPADVLLLRDWQGLFFRKIAVCVDFSSSSAANLLRAISVASAHRAVLEIIHVLFPPDRDPWGRVMDQPMDSSMDYDISVRERSRRHFDDFLMPFTDQLAGIDFSSIIIEGENPAAAISAHVDSMGIDLTVIGSREGSWVSDFVLGSNTVRLLHDSSSSVLMTRAWQT